jgi:4-amino-4-deoxy-L-arabinose transferase-like glycosyltransferase
VLVAGCWLYFLFLHGLGRRDLWNSHEARAAMDAQSLLEGDRLLPHLFDGRAELQKPPLYYWLVALTASVCGGVDAWTTRLPAALAGILCVGAVAVFGRLTGRRREGIFAAVVLATAVHFTWLARVARIDMPLTLATTVALLAFYQGWLVTAYVALAAAVLLKGPIGVVLVAAVLGLLRLTEGRVLRFGFWWGVPLVLGLALPWFVMANQQTGGELLRVFFWRHNVERGLGGPHLPGHPWWLYGPRFLADFAPWSVLFPVALVWFLRRGRWRQDREARFGLAWLVGMFVVLSCARYKRADYLVPAYPGAALFLGCVLVRWWEERRERYCEVSRTRLVVAAMILTGLAWWVRVEFVLPRGEHRLEQASFARAVREEAPRPAPVVLFRTEAHALAFHLGKPVRTVVEWQELQRAAAARPIHVVMPVPEANQWRQHLAGMEGQQLARSAPDHEKPMVLLRLSAGGSQHSAGKSVP